MKTGSLDDLRNVREALQGIDEEKRRQRHEDNRYGKRLRPAVLLAIAEEDKQDVAEQKQKIAEMQLRQDAQQEAGEDQPASVPADGSTQDGGCIDECEEQREVR